MFSRTMLSGWLSATLALIVAAVPLLATRVDATPLSLYLVDSGGNRVLRFSPPFTTGMSANAVIGQTSFTNSSTGLGPDVFDGPSAIEHDATGNLFVADSVNNRVLEFLQPIATGESASLVLGQPDFNSNSRGTALNQMSGAGALALDRRGAGALYVSVSAHVRQFVPPFSNGMNATLQLGNNGSIPQTIEPTGLSMNGNGDLFLLDGFFQRVLDYKAPIKSNQLADVVLGANSLNHSGQGVFYSPAGSAVDGKGNLWVADYNTHRVLEFVPPFWNDKRPSLVIGQPDYTSRSGSLSQNGLYVPTYVAFDGNGDLWVSDTGNNRVLEFVPPFSNGMNATIVIGQPDFISNGYGTSASQILAPGGLTFAP